MTIAELRAVLESVEDQNLPVYIPGAWWPYEANEAILRPAEAGMPERLFLQ